MIMHGPRREWREAIQLNGNNKSYLVCNSFELLINGISTCVHILIESQLRAIALSIHQFAMKNTKNSICFSLSVADEHLFFYYEARNQ